MYLQTWILCIAGHKGLINTGFYFGIGQESKRRNALGHGGTALCVHRALQGKYAAALEHGAMMLAAQLQVIKKKQRALL